MKKVTLALFSTALLLWAHPSFSQDDEKESRYKRFKYFKENKLSKSYPSGSYQLSIENSFGDVKFIAGTTNEIKVDVQWEASSDNEEQANKNFEAIKIDNKQEGNKISFVTSVKSKDDKNNCKNCKTSLRIDYVVQLPVTVPVTVENSFGKIVLPDYKGTLSITSKFGEVNAGNLQDVKKFDVEFGEAQVGSLSNVSASVKFGSISLKSLSGKNKLNMEFCGKSQIGLASNMESLELKESYSVVNLRPASNLSASYSISTNFGSVKDRANIGITRIDKPEKYGPDAQQKHAGKTGSGNAQINIKSDFGTIILGEPQAGDLDDKNSKNKNKNKNKNRVTT